jgi:hypothetical protein
MALDQNGQLIVDLVPELKFVIGDQPPVPEVPAQDAQRRFQLVTRRFIGVFARREHPLALFVDDLQWLDAATLDLLEDLLTRSEPQHLMLIGAYRDNCRFRISLKQRVVFLRGSSSGVHNGSFPSLSRRTADQQEEEYERTRLKAPNSPPASPAGAAGLVPGLASPHDSPIGHHADFVSKLPVNAHSTRAFANP